MHKNYSFIIYIKTLFIITYKYKLFILLFLHSICINFIYFFLLYIYVEIYIININILQQYIYIYITYGFARYSLEVSRLFLLLFHHSFSFASSSARKIQTGRLVCTDSDVLWGGASPWSAREPPPCENSQLQRSLTGVRLASRHGWWFRRW